MKYYSKVVLWSLRRLIFRGRKKRQRGIYSLKHTTIQVGETYGSSYLKNKFDVYTPYRKLPNSPAVIWVHGGGLVGGDKSELEDYALALSKMGYTIFSLNYNLVPESKYPEPVQQLSDFIDFLGRNTSKYKIDISNVFLAGNSAGAQIVAQFSTAKTNKRYAEKLKITLPQAHFNIRGLLLFCGFFNFQDLVAGDLSKVSSFLFKEIVKAYFSDEESPSLTDTSSIYEYISNAFPPTYITDGNTFSLEKQSRKMLAYLNESSVAVIYRFFDKKNIKVKHDYQFDLKGEAGSCCFEDVKLFLENTRRI